MYLIPRNRDALWPETSLFSSMRHGLMPEYLDLRAQEEEMTGSAWTPPMDFVEDKDRYVLYVDAPGMDKTDIDITFKDGILFVEGCREHEKEVGNGNSVRYLLERRCGELQSAFPSSCKYRGGQDRSRLCQRSAEGHCPQERKSRCQEHPRKGQLT